MKRRSFIQRLGLGTSGLVLTGNGKNFTLQASPLSIYDVNDSNDLKNSDGEILIRLNYSSTDATTIAGHEGRISIRKGKLKEVTSYFFHGGLDEMDYAVPEMEIHSYPGFEDVLLLVIAEGTNDTIVKFPLGKKARSASLKEIIDAKDLVLKYGDHQVTLSYLLEHEIGEIDPISLGIGETGENFVFTAMADPQGGNPFAHDYVQTRMRIHNAYIDESVRIVNELDPRPAFNIVIGDIVDGQGHHADFRAMNDMLEKVNSPTLYELGNHETKYRSVFSPGYNMKAFDNYFAAQKEFNGMEKLLYSFNLGKWHFVVWPDPLRNRFWETHPHYFKWLEKDLEKHKNQPVMFFQHVPVHPIGILPLINYAESVDVKRILLDILSKHGNVKYILSGHVHIPMRASVKTAAEIQGIKMINLPAAGYRPRAFGEEDFNGGPSQGVAIVKITGDEAVVSFKTVTGEEFTYPEPKPFDKEKYPLWFNHKWQLAKDEKIRNGSFRDGLKYWHRRYVYSEDVHLSNICETRKDPEKGSCLYLFNRSRGFSTAGQDRLPQSINRICQVIRMHAGTAPVLELEFKIDPDHHIPDNHAGCYIWLEGFEKGLKRLNVVYSNNYVHWHLGGQQSQLRTVLPVHMEISTEPGKWNSLVLNPVKDLQDHSEADQLKLEQMDTFAVNFGVWTLNEGYRKEAAASFTGVSTRFESLQALAGLQSNLNGQILQKKDQKYLWWHGVKHHAGEHKSIIEDLNKYISGKGIG